MDLAGIEAKKSTPQLRIKQGLGLDLFEGTGKPAEFPVPRKPGQFPLGKSDEGEFDLTDETEAEAESTKVPSKALPSGTSARSS